MMTECYSLKLAYKNNNYECFFFVFVKLTVILCSTNLYLVYVRVVTICTVFILSEKNIA